MICSGIAVKVDAVKAGSSGNSGNDEGYIRTTSILDIECGEELELNRDIACIYLVIALADWITTQEDEERDHLIRVWPVDIISWV